MLDAHQGADQLQGLGSMQYKYLARHYILYF